VTALDRYLTASERDLLEGTTSGRRWRTTCAATVPQFVPPFVRCRHTLLTTSHSGWANARLNFWSTSARKFIR